MPSDIAPVDEAVRRSWAQRQDLKSAEAQLRAAEEARKAAGAERLPSAAVNGYYGHEGTNPNRVASVFQASAAVSVPIFKVAASMPTRCRPTRLLPSAGQSSRMSAGLSSSTCATPTSIWRSQRAGRHRGKQPEARAGHLAAIAGPLCRRRSGLGRSGQFAGSAGLSRPRLRQQPVLAESGQASLSRTPSVKPKKTSRTCSKEASK